MKQEWKAKLKSIFEFLDNYVGKSDIKVEIHFHSALFGVIQKLALLVLT